MRFSSLFFALAMFGTPAASEVITIAAFNVENLFDTVDDPDNPRDDTYLPLSVKQIDQAAHNANCETWNGSTGFFSDRCKTLDWSDAVYSQKLARLGETILALGTLPEVIVVPETENAQVLEDLVDQALPGSGYRVVQLDTSDEPGSRGIDVGLLTTLPLAGTPTAHVVDFDRDEDTCGKTRDILQVPLELPNGETLHIFGVHFPSGGNPFRCRVRAMNNLNTLVGELPEGSLYVAAGDFNVNCNEGPTDSFARLLRIGNWYASPLVRSGCEAPGSSKFVDRRINNWNTWSFLDMILVSSTLSPSRPSDKNWFADLGSFSSAIVTSEQIMVDENDRGFIEPRRFDPVTGRGVSDHLPVVMRLISRRD